MARRLTEAPLTTATARAKLGRGIHWRGIDSETHLGYRKGNRAGRWLVRWRDSTVYSQATIGTADDAIKVGTLNFDAAVRAARAYVEQARLERKARADGPPLDVRAAVAAYVVERDERQCQMDGRTVRSDASRRLGRYVLGQAERGNQPSVAAAPLADVKLYKLTEGDLRAWRDTLPAHLKPTTRARTINDLKAALNNARRLHRRKLPPELIDVIRIGLEAVPDRGDHDVARENILLTDGLISALIRAARDVDQAEGWEGDLYRLIVVMAATGARFSQVRRIRVGDVQLDRGRIFVPASRKGRGVKSGSIPVPVGADTLEAIRPAIAGRAASEVVLERWWHRQEIGTREWKRTERKPWQSASDLKPMWKSIRAALDLPNVIPYALRHSSIVRGIRAGLPIRLVAAMHDTSTAMIERTYGKYIADGLDDLAARAVVPLVPPQEQGANVTLIHQRAGS